MYEVIEDNYNYFIMEDDNGDATGWPKTMFEEVKQETTNKFRFIPKTEITEVIVDGIEGILIKE